MKAGYQVKEIGKRFFVIYSFGVSSDADNNGNFSQAEMVMSRPYKTEVGANKSLLKLTAK